MLRKHNNLIFDFSINYTVLFIIIYCYKMFKLKKSDCYVDADKSDEDLHDEEETRKAIYKLLELHNIILS